MENIKKQNLRFFILSGVFYNVMLNLYNPFIVKFLQRIGGNEFHISLLNSLPGLVGILSSLPGAIYMIRRNQKGTKSHMIAFTMQSRLLILGFALVAFLEPNIAPWLLLFVFAVKSVPEAISQTAFQGFAGDLFNDDFRSTAISLRNKLGTPVAVVITLLSGYMLRILPKSEDDRMFLYQVFFIVSVLFGIFEILSYKAIKEPNAKRERQELNIKVILKEMRSHRKYISFTLSSLIFYFGWQMGWPLFNIYEVVNLGADEFWLCIIAVIQSVAAYIGYGYWNRMIQKKGNAIVASITTLGMATNPILIAISPNLYWVCAISVLTGFFTAGNTTVLLNGLLEATPQENRVIYVGTYNTLINISLMISPLVAHAVLKLTGIFWAMMIVAVIRLVGSAVFYLNHAKNVRIQDISQ